jgi:hypothetical protein
MKPLDQEWLKTIAEAIGKDEHEVLMLIKSWWNQNKPLSYINAELVRLAEANGKKLILVDQDNN